MQDDRPHEGGVYRGGSIATDLRVLYSLGPVDFRAMGQKLWIYLCIVTFLVMSVFIGSAAA